jgi:Zn-dependent M28 family amino/carboxypeptidase
MYKIKYAVIMMVTIVFASCAPKQDGITTAKESISLEKLKNRISVLASDDFEGRAPATAGEEKTINYLAEQFKEIGLEPGNGDSYFQEVGLVKMTAVPRTMEISGGKQNLSLAFSEDYIGGTPQIKDNVEIKKSEIVFVGYGINAPENNWNDYEGLDVKGKTVLMLVNDPGYHTLDANLFNGKAMTIYGRWTYKFEEAARQGATAAIIIHETGAAAYPWAVVQNSWTGSQLYLDGNELAKSDLQLQSWVTTESAQKIFASAGLNYDELSAAAAKPGFIPIPMKLKASLSFKNEVVHTSSNNVVAVWPGANKADEYVVYTAHWDHFGINPDIEGDNILNGALDNATGTAAIVSIAEAFTKLPSKQDRSVLFMAVTCEEFGLLGSKFYAENPIYPLDKTIGAINIDALNIDGKTKDMTIIGLGNSTIDDFAVNILEADGRYVMPDHTPEQGSYFRSDHFNFAKVGVPSLYLARGVDNVEHGKEWGLEASKKWLMANYHKPSDNYEPDVWKFDGMLEDVKVYFEVGYDMSMSEEFPGWAKDSPFKAARDKMMKK